jgi:hypothetical protein
MKLLAYSATYNMVHYLADKWANKWSDSGYKCPTSKRAANDFHSAFMEVAIIPAEASVVQTFAFAQEQAHING